MNYVLYRSICNLVPFDTDIIYGRHLGFQNYTILVFGNVIQLTCTLVWQVHNIRLPRMFSLCWHHVKTWETHSLKRVLTLDTKVVMNKDAIRTVNAVEEIGQRQYSESVVDRLKIASNKPLSDIVSKNKLALFSTPQIKQRSRSKEQVKTKCTLFSRFYIACKARQSILDSFVEHENQACPPPSISDMGQL